MTSSPSYQYAATVIRWVDGDTVWLDVDLGFRMTTATDFRLFGIDTPERGRPGYAEATALAASLAPAGSAVVISTYKDPDKYGRWLALVTPAGAAASVNDQLVRASLAVPYFGGKKTAEPAAS